MSPVQARLAALIDDPAWLRSLNGWLTIFWLANYPPVIALYLLIPNDSFQSFCLLYLALVSIWANVASSASTWQAARVEERQAAEEARRRAEDVPADVVAAMVKHTTVERSQQPPGA